MNSVTNLLQNNTIDNNFSGKISFDDEPISILMVTSTDKIVIFKAMKIQEKFKESQCIRSVTVWRALWRGGDRAVFFENEDGEAITVNEEGYCVMINTYNFRKIKL